MPYSGKAGDSFYLPDIHGKHRWVILTDPDEKGCVVIVNFTDATNNSCPTIFTPKDHRYFSKRTSLNCAAAAIVFVSGLEGPKRAEYEYFDERLVRKIITEVIGNMHTPPDVIEKLKPPPLSH